MALKYSQKPSLPKWLDDADPAYLEEKTNLISLVSQKKATDLGFPFVGAPLAFGDPSFPPVTTFKEFKKTYDKYFGAETEPCKFTSTGTCVFWPRKHGTNKFDDKYFFPRLAALSFAPDRDLFLAELAYGSQKAGLVDSSNKAVFPFGDLKTRELFERQSQARRDPYRQPTKEALAGERNFTLLDHGVSPDAYRKLNPLLKRQLPQIMYDGSDGSLIASKLPSSNKTKAAQWDKIAALETAQQVLSAMFDHIKSKSIKLPEPVIEDFQQLAEILLQTHIEDLKNDSTGGVKLQARTDLSSLQSPLKTRILRGFQSTANPRSRLGRVEAVLGTTDSGKPHIAFVDPVTGIPPREAYSMTPSATLTKTLKAVKVLLMDVVKNLHDTVVDLPKEALQDLNTLIEIVTQKHLGTEADGTTGATAADLGPFGFPGLSPYGGPPLYSPVPASRSSQKRSPDALAYEYPAYAGSPFAGSPYAGSPYAGSPFASPFGAPLKEIRAAAAGGRGRLSATSRSSSSTKSSKTAKHPVWM